MVKLTQVKQQLDIQEVIKLTSQTKKINKNGRVLIVEMLRKIDETTFLLVKIYDPNTETEQVATLHDLDNMLETIKDIINPSNCLLKKANE